MASRSPAVYPVQLADIPLQVTEWPGRSDPVLLLHATGFHARCWDAVVRLLPDAHVYAVDLRFHGGSGQGGAVDWGVMTGDIRALLQQLELAQAVGVGHSIGGYLLARAAAGARERFRQLVLIDPVILPRDDYRRRFPEGEPVAPSVSPVSRRKNRWRDAAEMFERFRDKPPFDRWQERVLRDYCEYALRTVPGESDYQLACDPLHEAAIYLNQQGNEVIYELLPQLTLPVTLLRAKPELPGVMDFSRSPTWPGLAGALPRAREFYLPGMSHFIPMEDPGLVARTVCDALDGRWS